MRYDTSIMKTKQTEVQDPHSFHVSLKLILENGKGEALILKLPETSSMAGYYDLPGGRINTGELRENYEKIIKREVKEELGGKVRYRLRMRPVSMARHIYFSKKQNRESCIFLVFMKAEYLGGEIELSDEHVACEWVKLDARKINRYFIKGLQEGLKNYLKWNPCQCRDK